MALTYNYEIPLEVRGPVAIFKLNLLDATLEEKFGDAMTGICTIQQEKSTFIVEESKEESQRVMRFSITDRELLRE